MKIDHNPDGTKTVQLRLEARPCDDGWVHGGVMLDGEFIELARVTRPLFDNDATVVAAFGELLKVLAAAAVRSALGDKAADSVQVARFSKVSEG